MIWVGVTGGMGCGKSTVISFFKEQGFSVVSADDVVHDLYLSPEVVREVSSLLNLDFEKNKNSSQISLSKEKIAAAVFSDPNKLKKLEGYLHPLVRKRVETLKRNFSKNNEQIAFYEVPLLFEKNMQEGFDHTVCVGADRAVQIQRIQKRNTWSLEEIERRLESQLPLERKKDLADFYINNSSSLEDLKKSCVNLIGRLKSKEIKL